MPRNITNGEFTLDVNEDDKVEQDYKLMKLPTSDSLDYLREDKKNVDTNYYIENLRSGQFTEISENYMLESSKEKQELLFTRDSFESEMKSLYVGFQNKMNKVISFFQGLFTGMALLYTITLNLSVSISKDLVRVQDQTIRILAIISSFGALYSFFLIYEKKKMLKTSGTSSQIDTIQKSYILSFIEMILYTASYIIYNVSHLFAVNYNIQGSDYGSLSLTTTIYTIFTVLAWVFTNVNTYKYET